MRKILTGLTLVLLAACSSSTSSPPTTDTESDIDISDPVVDTTTPIVTTTLPATTTSTTIPPPVYIPSTPDVATDSEVYAQTVGFVMSTLNSSPVDRDCVAAVVIHALPTPATLSDLLAGTVTPAITPAAFETCNVPEASVQTLLGAMSASSMDFFSLANDPWGQEYLVRSLTLSLASASGSEVDLPCTRAWGAANPQLLAEIVATGSFDATAEEGLLECIKV